MIAKSVIAKCEIKRFFTTADIVSLIQYDLLILGTGQFELCEVNS